MNLDATGKQASEFPQHGRRARTKLAVLDWVAPTWCSC
jgi:hypothetical protein